MATYKEIFGKEVKVLSSDPTNEVEGQIWYNTTSRTFKSVVAGAAWSSASPLGTERTSTASCGTQTAGLWFGGETPAGANNATEEYNGSGFSTGGNLNTGRYYLVGAGTQTAGLAAGGSVLPQQQVEEYNGASWTTSPGSLPSGTSQSMGAGLQTAAFYTGGTPQLTATYEYDGSTWTAGGALNSGRANSMAAGTQTAGLIGFGYRDPFSNQNSTEEYNGTGWTTVNSGNTARRNVGGWGLQTSAICAGGYTTTSVTTTEEYDGTNWTATASLGNAGAIAPGGAGTSIPAGLVASGTVAEEYNVLSTVITAGAWASGGALPGNRSSQGGTIGDGTTQLGVSGQVTYPLFTNSTEEYASSVWTAGGVYPTTIRAAFGGGTVTAAWMTGGETSVPNGPALSATNTYNGTSWTAGTAYPNTTVQASGCGPQTAGLAWAGNTSWGTSPQTTTFEYNGPAWTAGGAFPQAMQANGWAGTQTAALHVGGGTSEVFSATYNGTSWTAAPDMYRIVYGGSVAGTNTAALLFAFDSPPTSSGDNALCGGFDGTSWYTQPSLGTSRASGLSRSGTATAAIGAGGYTDPARIDNTEEFTGETSAANYKTITTS